MSIYYKQIKEKIISRLNNKFIFLMKKGYLSNGNILMGIILVLYNVGFGGLKFILDFNPK